MKKNFNSKCFYNIKTFFNGDYLHEEQTSNGSNAQFGPSAGQPEAGMFHIVYLA